MDYKVLLAVSTNVEDAKSEEKFRFIRHVIEALNINLDFWDSEEFPLSIETRRKLRQLQNEYDLVIRDDPDGGVEVFCDNQIIATWRQPTFILKHDHSQIDPKKQLYLEMQVGFTSIFEDS